MESNIAPAGATPQAHGGARFGRVERWLLWLMTSCVATVAIAWLAVQLQSGGFAPVLLLPLVVGAAVAAAIEGLAHLAGVRPGRRWLAVAAGAGLLLIAAQAYIGYVVYEREYALQAQRHPKLGLLRGGEDDQSGQQGLGPASFGHYMESRFGQSPGWALWTADALATLVGAVGWTAWRLRSRSDRTRPAQAGASNESEVHRVDKPSPS